MRGKRIFRKAAAFLLSLSIWAGSIPAVVWGAELQQEMELTEEEIQDTQEGATEEEEQMYHYSQEDLSTILVWKEKYMPNGFEDLLQYDEEWWDSLYGYERELAEFLKGQIVELSEYVYDGQDMDACIRILESGTSAGDFFAGTIYHDLILEDLYGLREQGQTLEDIYSRQQEKLEQVNPKLRTSSGDLVANMSLTDTGYEGTSHGKIWKITLGGRPGVCLSKGKSAKSGYLYHADEGTYELRHDGIGYLVSRADLPGYGYACVQIALWLYQSSDSYSREEVEERAYGMLNASDTVIENMLEPIWNNYSNALTRHKDYYIFYSDNSNAQAIGVETMPEVYTYQGSSGGSSGDEGSDADYGTGTVCAAAEDSVEVEARLTVTKHDSITGEGVPGAQIVINSGEYTTDSEGKASRTEEDEYETSAEGPSCTYVEDWDSLTEDQKADADANGYYHSYDEAYSASWGQANAVVQEELDDWADDWETYFNAYESSPPYGYTNEAGNRYETDASDGDHKTCDFYNKPWEAWIRVVKYDRITGQTDASLADAAFTVYEYNRKTGAYDRYRYADRQVMTDPGDGSYQVGPLYYNPGNEGKFLIMETCSPHGYTIDQKTNRFYFEITGEQQITYSNGNEFNQEGVYIATREYPHAFYAYNEPWKVRVDAVKVDEDTGNTLSDVRFDILRYDRESGDYVWKTGYEPDKIRVTEQLDGTYLSEWVYWNYENQGKFYLVETEARKGYFGDWKDRLTEWITGHPAGWKDDDADGKTAYYFEITGSRTEPGIVSGYNNQTTLRAAAGESGTIVNERTKGRVTVIKYDTESESRIHQGDASLDGAVYELRAAEDIIHADGHTGVIWKKGELVRTGTVGEIPGGFSFEDIELGSYTLQEAKASEGYLLDQTVYHLTFSYGNETQRVVLRDESASRDENTLTVDDEDTGHEKLYSGEYVKKQAFSLVKTSDNQYQTELLPVAGAGFKVYLISELQKVKDGTLKPSNGDIWSEADIQRFYDYDFSEEETATVYKRTLEPWTDGDTRWLVPVTDGNKNEYRVGEMFTDQRGELVSPELPYGTYVVVETTVPEDHVMARPFLVEVKEDNREVQPARYISDNQTEVYLRLVKADSDFLPSAGTVLKPEELVAGTVLKEGASYRIKAASLTGRELETLQAAGWKLDAEGYIWYYEPSSRKVYGTEEMPFEPVLQRDRAGKIVDCYITLPAKLPTGVYKVTELHAPSGYVKNGQEDQLTDTSRDGLYSYQVSDAPRSALVFAVDNSSVYPEGQMGERKYMLTDSYGNLVCTVFQDNQEQKGILELIKYGEKLYGVERSGEDYRFVYQDAPVEGAVFEVYAAEDIYTQELDTARLAEYGVSTDDYRVYAKDQKVAALTTDRTGYAYLADLYIGKYYIRETYSGEGFVRNPKIQHFEITAQDEHVSFEWVQSLYENQRQKINLQIQKEDADNGTGLKGAVYGLYNRRDIVSSIMENTDKTLSDYRHISHIFDYINCGQERLLIPADTLIAAAVTNEEGSAVFDEDLPLGEYYVRELQPPTGYTSTDQTEDVDARWQGQELEIQEHTDIVFRNQRTKHIFTKSDIVSGVHIEGAYLEIRDALDDRLIDAWVSEKEGEEVHYFYEDQGFYLELEDASELPSEKELIIKEGHLIEGLEVGKTYILRETLAPENYVHTEEIRFTVEDNNLVREHDMQDQRTVGSFSVVKEGEFFVGTEDGLRFIDKVKNLFYTIFQYVLGRVERASFEVYVKEDIYTPDQTGAYAEWTNSSGDKLKLKKDVWIETITTNPFGLATIENLPLGTYYVKETAAGNGSFLLNQEQKEVTLSYADQYTPVVFQDSVSYINERQTIQIRLYKRELNTDIPLKGAVFGVYAGEDLHGFVVDEEKVVSAYPEPLVKKDTLLETVETDMDGTAVFTADVPNGTYYVKELQAPAGHLKTEEVWYFDASYQGADSEKELVFSQIVYNEAADTVIVEIRKTTMDGETPLKDAELVLLDTDGRQIAAWASTEEAYRIEKLPIGTYILRELRAPSGYEKAADMILEVLDMEEIQTFVLKNEKASSSHEDAESDDAPSAEAPGIVPKSVDEPNTGDVNHWLMWSLAGLLSVWMILLLMRRRR